MDLLDLLTKNLGVSSEQAKGGAGLLFNLAKQKLGGSDFSKIADLVPGMSGILKSAPKSGGLLGTIGGLASAFGGGSKIGDLANLAGGFSKLGLDADMIQKFIPVILSFIESKGGKTVKDILSKVLK